MNVSHETLEQFDFLQEEVLKWNRKINLIGRGTTADIFQHHIADSVQIFEEAPEFNSWCDMGSGGGFPALVIAIASRKEMRDITMIESDARKSAFLRHVSHVLQLNTVILTARIERTDPVRADIISARALAPLTKLLAYGARHGVDTTTYLFPKGARYEDEILEALVDWRFSVQVIPSRTSRNSVILKIWDLKLA